MSFWSIGNLCLKLNSIMFGMWGMNEMIAKPKDILVIDPKPKSVKWTGFENKQVLKCWYSILNSTDLFS